MRVEIFDHWRADKLQESINDFLERLEKNNYRLDFIQYSTYASNSDNSHSAMIGYSKNEGVLD